MFTDINNLGEKENESILLPIPLQPITPRLDKETEDARSAKASLPSHISIEPADTLDYSNCATSPSKSTVGYVSSIPGTIYYEGMDSVTRPHIENARVVSKAELFDDHHTPQKVRPTRNTSENSSVPRMNWSPPQPLAGNHSETQSSRPNPPPEYVAQPYTSSALQGHIVPAVPIEDITMDGLTDTVRKRDVDKSTCNKVKSYKSLLLLTALIVILAISAVVFSIIYVTAIDAEDAEGRESEITAEAGNKCHPDCYDSFQPKIVCECECYTKKDDKYYICGDRGYLPDQNQTEYMYNSISEDTDTSSESETGTDTNTGSDSETDSGIDTDTSSETGTDTNTGSDDIDNSEIEIDNDDETDTSLVFVDDLFALGDDTILTAYAGDDDDDYYDDDEIVISYDDRVVDDIDKTASPCAKMCYRRNIHRRWDPIHCHPDCYCNSKKCPTKASSKKFLRRYNIWKEWEKSLDDDRLEVPTAAPTEDDGSIFTMINHTALDLELYTGDDDDGDDDSITEVTLGVATPNPTNVFESAP